MVGAEAAPPNAMTRWRANPLEPHGVHRHRVTTLPRPSAKNPARRPRPATASRPCPPRGTRGPSRRRRRAGRPISAAHATGATPLPPPISPTIRAANGGRTNARRSSGAPAPRRLSRTARSHGRSPPSRERQDQRVRREVLVGDDVHRAVSVDRVPRPRGAGTVSPPPPVPRIAQPARRSPGSPRTASRGGDSHAGLGSGHDDRAARPGRRARRAPRRDEDRHQRGVTACRGRMAPGAPRRPAAVAPQRDHPADPAPGAHAHPGRTVRRTSGPGGRARPRCAWTRSLPILAAQDAEGWWVQPGSRYGPKYRGWFWSLIFLEQMGADPRHRKVQRGVRVRPGARDKRLVEGSDGPRPRGVSVPHCLTGGLTPSVGRLRTAGRRPGVRACHRVGGERHHGGTGRERWYPWVDERRRGWASGVRRVVSRAAGARSKRMRGFAGDPLAAPDGARADERSPRASRFLLDHDLSRARVPDRHEGQPPGGSSLGSPKGSWPTHSKEWRLPSSSATAATRGCGRRWRWCSRSRTQRGGGANEYPYRGKLSSEVDSSPTTQQVGDAPRLPRAQGRARVRVDEPSSAGSIDSPRWPSSPMSCAKR